MLAGHLTHREAERYPSRPSSPPPRGLFSRRTREPGLRRAPVWQTIAADPARSRFPDCRAKMALNVRHPVWLGAAPAPGIRVFSLLYMIETFARASLATVIPIQAFDLIRDEQQVSFLYTGVAVLALAFSLVIPVLIRRLTRKWVYTLGGVFLIAAAAAMAAQSVAGQSGGMVLRVMGTACLNVTLNLYVLDHIRRDQFVTYDSTRLVYATFGWTAAPYFGVWLYTWYGPEYPFLFSAASAFVLLCLFWYLRLSDNRIIARGPSRPASPLGSVRRFFRQPRLRLAWAIAFGRSSFWSTFFVYGPILMIVGGQGKEAGGLLVSAANFLLITVIWWGRLSRRTGVRRLTAFAFAAAAFCLIGAGWLGAGMPLLAAAALLAAAFFIVPLDAVGGVAYYRAVHPHERTEMTAVYRSYMDMGELLPPLVYGLLLAWFGLGVVFVALAALLVFCAWLSWRHLPAKL